jgi:hypothetical protein
MKSHRFALASFVFVTFVSAAGMVHAIPFEDSAAEARWISTDGNTPASNGWFRLGLPDVYDPALVTLFDITLAGHGDNSSHPIDIFLSFDDKATYTKVASYNVQNNTSFTLALDIFNNDLLYQGNDVGNLSNVSLASFEGLDHFWLGYGCHFWHDSSTVRIDQATPTPEPATMLLLGSGLIGVAYLRRKGAKSPK